MDGCDKSPTGSGRYIVEFEQQGNAKAKYGDSLHTSLAKLLRTKLRKGFSRPSLYNMRRFYLMYPIFQTVSRKLSWSHICELITIDASQLQHCRLACGGTPHPLHMSRTKLDSLLLLQVKQLGRVSNLLYPKVEEYAAPKQ